MTRDEWLPFLREVLEGRPVRWAAPKIRIDGDTAELALEVFEADLNDQIELMSRFYDVCPLVEESLGTMIRLCFYSTQVTAQRFPNTHAKRRGSSQRFAACR